jgi:ferredoxin--NADP+ reductase
MESDPYNATVTHRNEINSGLIIVRVQPDDPLFDFQAGQYTVLGMMSSEARVAYADPEEEPSDKARLIRRAYSIASSSKQGDFLEFYVSLVHSGKLTPRLFRLKPGGRLWLGKKAVGQFTLSEVRHDHNLLLISTGTGLAPYLSMIRTAHQCGKGRKFFVVHGARYSWDLGYRSELEALDHGCGTFSYLPTVSRVQKDQSWSGHVGRIQSVFEDGSLEELVGGPLDPERLSVFLCGNPSMVEAVEERFEEKGFELHRKGKSGNLHVERYW